MVENERTGKTTAQLIVSDDEHPVVKLEPGMRLDVVATKLVTPELGEAKGIAARLCGGTSTCLAIVDVS